MLRQFLLSASGLALFLALVTSPGFASRSVRAESEHAEEETAQDLLAESIYDWAMEGPMEGSTMEDDPPSDLTLRKRLASKDADDVEVAVALAFIPLRARVTVATDRSLRRQIDDILRESPSISKVDAVSHLHTRTTTVSAKDCPALDSVVERLSKLTISTPERKHPASKRARRPVLSAPELTLSVRNNSYAVTVVSSDPSAESFRYVARSIEDISKCLPADDRSGAPVESGASQVD